MKAVGFVPMNHPEQSVRAAAEAIALGVSAVWLPSEATGGISPSHVAYDPLWATLQDAGVPLVLHIGGGKLLDKVFHDNGHPRPTDWLGGGENLRAKDFPVMHHSPERFLTCLVLDGVLDRFPGLRIGVIELGASWVPGMLRNLDHAHTSFGRSEPLLQGLSLKPSEFVRRQVRFTPFPFEDAGWLVDQAGPELFMFSTDYPHPEGGRRPYERFTESLAGHDEATLDRFFRTNGFELLGLG
jgi:predicted TIM-barrel fold metal-dependent hydrolase